MKCKLFNTSINSSLETEINGWLDRNKSISVVNIQFSTSKSEYSTTFSCLIFYKELTEVRKDKLNNLNQI